MQRKLPAGIGASNYRYLACSIDTDIWWPLTGPLERVLLKISVGLGHDIDPSLVKAPWSVKRPSLNLQSP